MKRFLVTTLSLLAATAVSHASLSFVGNSYAIISANGGGNTYYDVSNQGNDNSTPNYVGQTFTIGLGQSLLLGGQTQTYPGGFGTTAWMGYRLLQGATVISENDNINLSYLQTANNNDYWQQLATTGGINLNSGLSINTYTLEVWFGASNGNTLFDSNGGANYSATISVVPEPVYPALIGFALVTGLVQVARRYQPKFRFACAS